MGTEDDNMTGQNSPIVEGKHLIVISMHHALVIHDCTPYGAVSNHVICPLCE